MWNAIVIGLMFVLVAAVTIWAFALAIQVFLADPIAYKSEIRNGGGEGDGVRHNAFL
jgi:hypothetical protein